MGRKTQTPKETSTTQEKSLSETAGVTKTRKPRTTLPKIIELTHCGCLSSRKPGDENIPFAYLDFSTAPIGFIKGTTGEFLFDNRVFASASKLGAYINEIKKIPGNPYDLILVKGQPLNFYRNNHFLRKNDPDHEIGPCWILPNSEDHPLKEELAIISPPKKTSSTTTTITTTTTTTIGRTSSSLSVLSPTPLLSPPFPSFSLTPMEASPLPNAPTPLSGITPNSLTQNELRLVEFFRKSDPMTQSCIEIMLGLKS